MPISRRSFVAGASAFTLSTRTWNSALAAALGKRHLLIVGTETTGKSTAKGIYFFAFDSATGDFEQLSLAAETPGPTFLALAPGNRLLFAANESGLPDADGKSGRGGMITSYAFDAVKQSLTQINQVSSAGADPVYVSVDHTGKCVFAANYGSGSMASMRVESDGKLGDPVSHFDYNPAPPAGTPAAATAAPRTPGAARGAGAGGRGGGAKRSHAHRATPSPDNKFLLVNDLGLDQIHIYQLDAATATLTPHGNWDARPGDGPRGLRFHPNHRIAYCVNETQPTIHVLAWDAAGGALSKLQTIPFIPEDASPNDCHPGDIVFDKQIAHAYVSTRRDNTVTVLNVAADGMLSINSKLDSGGIRPRDLTMDPTDNWVIVANQDSNNLSALKRDPKTGALADQKKSAAIDQPMCVIFPERSSII